MFKRARRWFNTLTFCKIRGYHYLEQPFNIDPHCSDCGIDTTGMDFVGCASGCD